MNKLFATLLAGLCAVAAHAQNPAGVSPEQGNATNSKAQQSAEDRKAARPAGQVKPPAGDASKTAEGGAIGADKAAVAGQGRADTRDQRYPNRDSNLKRRSTQGPTPDSNR